MFMIDCSTRRRAEAMTQVMGTSLTRFGGPSPIIILVHQCHHPCQHLVTHICENQVEVPATLEVGEYVLSFRWDCKCTPQVALMVVVFMVLMMVLVIVHGCPTVVSWWC